MGAKRKFVIALVSIALVLVFVLAVREWSKTDSADSIHSMIKTSDGGYAMIGTSDFESTTSLEDQTLWLVKTDASGNVQWDKSYRGVYGAEGFSLAQTNDDGFVFAGSARSSDSDSYRYLLVKTDQAGNAEWNRTYGEGRHGFYSVIQTEDGGYALVGARDYYSETYFWFIKTDANGNRNKQWNKTCPGIARSMVQTRDGGYVLAGRGIRGVFWLAKTDADGNIKWEKEYEMPNAVSAALDVIETSNGGYVLTGNLFRSIYADPLSAQDDLASTGQALWMIETDPVGNMLWNKTHFGAAPGYAGSVIQTRDGGYAATASSYLIKTDAVGTELWNETYGERVRPWLLVQTDDGGFVLAGSISSNGGDFWLTMTNSDGKVEWTKTYGRQRFTILALVIEVKAISTELATKPVVHVYAMVILETS